MHINHFFQTWQAWWNHYTRHLPNNFVSRRYNNSPPQVMDNMCVKYYCRRQFLCGNRCGQMDKYGETSIHPTQLCWQGFTNFQNSDWLNIRRVPIFVVLWRMLSNFRNHYIAIFCILGGGNSYIQQYSILNPMDIILVQSKKIGTHENKDNAVTALTTISVTEY